MTRGESFTGRECGRCGGTERYVATKRCVHCMRTWVARSVALRERRAQQIGQPCALCALPLDEPVLDEHPGTGVERGWLHHRCNLLLGVAEDDLILLHLAVAYLESY